MFCWKLLLRGQLSSNMDYKFLQVSRATPASLEGLLPEVLERKISKGERILIVCASSNQCQRLDEFLWSFEGASFMPHDVYAAGYTEDEQEGEILSSICLISSDMLTDDVIKHFPMHCVLTFSTQDTVLPVELLEGREVLDFFISTDIAQANARKRWKLLKEKNVTPSYFAQGARGGWQKKN